jgi:hypothetical protein
MQQAGPCPLEPDPAQLIESAKEPTMLTTTDVASWTPAQRAELVRALIDEENPVAASRQWWQHRAVIAAGMIGAAAVLTVWICYLIPTLPDKQSTPGWRVAWIGFDLAEVVCYLITAWAAWRHRPVVAPALFASAILLGCDAWFDLTLSLGSRGWTTSAVLAGGVEIPFAVVLCSIALRINRPIRHATRAVHVSTAGWRHNLPERAGESAHQQPPRPRDCNVGRLIHDQTVPESP